MITALLRACKAETFTQCVEQRDPRVDLERVPFAVDGQPHREDVGPALLLCWIGRNLFKRHGTQRAGGGSAGQGAKVFLGQILPM